jgi:hypothetical protein
MLSEAYGGEAMKKSRVSEWRERFKRVLMFISQKKKMLITSYDIKGIVHFELLLLGQSTKFIMWKG